MPLFQWIGAPSNETIKHFGTSVGMCLGTGIVFYLASLAGKGIWSFYQHRIQVSQYENKEKKTKQNQMEIYFKEVFDLFTQRNFHLGYLDKLSKPLDPEICERIPIKADDSQNSISVIIGESGIGKTTAICAWTEELRNQQKAVHYMVANESSNYSYREFLKACFKTDDSDLIITALMQLKEKKKKVFLVIDNIHYCKNQYNQIDTELLTFLNGILVKNLGMTVILLSSINNSAYEIKQSKILNSKLKKRSIY